LFLYPSIFFFIFFFLQLFAPQTIDSLPSYLQQLQQILSSQKKYPPSLLPSLKLSPLIETVIWDDEVPATKTLTQIIKKGGPVVIRQGPAAAWPISKWDLLDILKSGNDLVMEGMRWQPEPVFILGRDRDEGGMLGKESDQPLQYLNSSLSEFLRSLFNTSEYFYWSGELSWIEEVTGTSATRPSSSPSSASHDWSVFKYLDPLLQDSLDEQDVVDLWVPMIWLSHPGVVAQTHYDPQHNFLSQIQGSKRVILFPPSETSLYLFPHIHRSYRQSQLPLELHEPSHSFSEPNSTTDHLFPSLPQSGVEVVLHPGDTLYIPPYWFHRVEALTMSLSISVTSPTAEEAQFSEIYWQTLPLGPFSNSSEGKMIGAKVYLGLLLYLLQSEFQDSLRVFSEQLYQSRYLPLFPELLERDPDLSPPMACPPYPTEESVYGKLIQEHSNALHTVAMKSAEAIKAIRCDVEVKKNFMRDYVEELSRWAVGAVETAAFIRDCLR
jgi:hypothetical protein